MMSSSMGPPALLGFSLRVQLFSPNAYEAGDKPLRCFRVVTSPDVTVREFCEEACRIHEINYGEPLAIKKCQDDQRFDVTQSEVLGHLFTSTTTIRVIQASPTVSIRDSVPPDSALRYDPALLSQQRKKRGRGSSVRVNGALSPALSSNKRQKLSEHNPDHPIPSLEQYLESSHGERNASIIPNSQQSMGRHSWGGRDEIRDSVSPRPSMNIEKRSTDQHYYKPATASKINTQSAITQGSPSRPPAPTSAPAKSMSTSYRIERATEPGTPVSTRATSPSSADQQLPLHNQSTSTNKTRLSGSARVNGKPGTKPRIENSIYDVDEIETNNASVYSTFDKTKASLKVRKSPVNKPSRQEWRDKFNTPPNGNRRGSRGSDQVPTPESPLTSSSKQREEKQQQSYDAKKSQIADEAAEQQIRETSEQKWREANEASKSNRAKSADIARLKKEEQEKVAAEKQAAINATAARLEKERVEKIQQLKRAEEERQAEQKRGDEARIKKAKEQAENLEREKKARAEKQKQEKERIRKEKAKAKAEAEAEQRRKEDERERKAEAAAAADAAAAAVEVSRKPMEQIRAEVEAKERQLSASVESARAGSRTGPRPVPRPQSSTPFIPSGRKSALKPSQSTLSVSPMPSGRKSALKPSQALSSPMPGEYPSEASIRSSQIAPIRDGTRRVSFNLEATPVRPSTSDRRSRKLQMEVPQEMQSQTPILPPGVKFSMENPTTPILPTKKPTSITPPVSTTPKVSVKSAAPAPTPSKKNETVRRPIAKGKPKAVKPAPALHSKRDTSSEGSDSDQDMSEYLAPANIPISVVRPNTRSKKPASKPQPAPEEKVNEDQDEDVEIGSRQSTPPETRSPVVFNHHPAALAHVPTLKLSKTTGVTEDKAETQPLSDSSSIDDRPDHSSQGEGEDDTEDDDEDEDEVEGENEDGEMDDVESEGDKASTVKTPRSSLDLSRPQLNSQHSVSGGKSKPRTIRLSPDISDKEWATQDAIDSQLTSSMFEAQASSSSEGRNRHKREPPSSLPSSKRPRFRIGASLRDLNTAQSMAGRSRAIRQRAVNGNHTLKSLRGEESGSQSESDSADDSDSDSNDEGAASRAFDAQLFQSQSVPLPSSDEDSSDDSDNEDKYKEKMRDQLVTDLARMVQKTASQKNALSSSSQLKASKDKSRVAGRDIVKAEKKKREKKYLTGYTFSQVK